MISLFGKNYCFDNSLPSFGQTAAFIVPSHGDFNCGCEKCRTYRAVCMVEKVHNVRLVPCLDSFLFNNNMQETAYKSAKIYKITLPSVYNNE